MRVVQVISSLHPKMGGLPKSAASISASLASHDVQSALIFFSSEEELTEVKDVYRDLPGFEKVKLYPLHSRRVHSFFSAGLKEALDDFSPDIIQTHGLWEPLLAHAHSYALQKKIPYVVMPHSMLHPWQSRQHRWAKNGLKYLLGWKARWRQAAFIQVLNKVEAEHWQAEGLPQTRYIPNGIFPSEDPGKHEKQYSELPSQPFILFLGRLHPQKAPDLLLRAFAQLPEDLQLVMAGPDFGLKTRLHEMAVSLGCADRVYFPGSLQGEVKWAALHQCRCFCLPSRAEGFSMAILEAALAGAPLVITPECYVDELAEAGGARVSDLDPTSLALAIEESIFDGAQMGSAAREWVMKHCNWDRIIEQLLEAYREALR